MIFDTRPSIVGHRGFGAGCPAGFRENTVASFLAAVASGLSWVELDVRRSRDGELVVNHDPVAPSGAVIVTRTAAELAAHGVASLAEVLAALPATVGVDIDVKTILADAVDPPGQRTHGRVAEFLHQYRGTRPFLVSSFDPSVPAYLSGLRELTGSAALGLITGSDIAAERAIPAAANLGLDVVCVHAGSVGAPHDDARLAVLTAERVIHAAHQAGLEVLTWSPSPAEAVVLARAGVDALCVNDVPGVQAALTSAACSFG
jgi:glycerophosphoryl diester phosphodiesterase